MKRVLLLLLIIVNLACDNSDDRLVSHQVLLPVETVTMATEFTLNQDYLVSMTYLRPSTCHAFNGVYYVKHINERTVAIINTVFTENGGCQEISTELEASFTFRATELGSYIFKFWQGTDSSGEDIYLTMEIPVN